MGWDEMRWDGLRWDGMVWDGCGDGCKLIDGHLYCIEPIYPYINISIARNVHEIELAVPEQPEPLNLMGTFMKLPDSGSRRSLPRSSENLVFGSSILELAALFWSFEKIII